MLTDSYNRQHNYLRISLTDQCNLRCNYCMPLESYSFMPSTQLMQAAEILEIAKIFTSLGTTKIRLTGGEPLVRKDADRIIQSLAALPVKLSLTTNGVRVHEFIETFKQAGIRSLNLSLDTLSADKFQLLTKRNNFNRVWENIQLLLQNGFHVKLNMVVMKGINHTEINDFINLTRFSPLHIRFIEFMPFTGNKWASEKVFTLHEMLEFIQSKYSITKLEDAPNDTAKKYTVPGHAGSFAVISTLSAPFCTSCNRMRLTADGKMKNCLFSKAETDLLSALRNGQDIEALIRKNILDKEAERGGQFLTDFEHLHSEDMTNRSMIAIGG